MVFFKNIHEFNYYYKLKFQNITDLNEIYKNNKILTESVVKS